MATPVKMPELGESITEGTITRWIKQEGDRVEADEPLFEVSTDKVDTEVPSPVAGVLKTIKVQADETVEVGAELALIAGGDGAAARAEPAEQEQTTAQPAEAQAEAEPEARPAATEKPKEAKAKARGDGKAAALVSPLVRRLAREHDVDLSQVEGSGTGGRVRREDVEAFVEQRGKTPAEAPAAKAETKGKAKAAAAPAAAPQVAVPLAKGLREEVVPATRLRKLIAERMVASLQTSAQLTSAVEIDMTRVMRLRERARRTSSSARGSRSPPCRSPSWP
jgi:pyruvate dehydrogenase E2 component (dihydrolipoamide acetyltransferase)